MEQEPKTLQEAVIYFADSTNCRKYLVARRWPEGVTCPHCGSKQVVFSEKFNRWQCGSHHDRRQFTLKTGTIFEDSPIGLDKWLLVMWQVVNCKNGVSSYEISRAIGVTQKSTWFMLHRLREVMQDPQTGGMLSGHVEVDESFIGAKSRNMHADKRAEKIHGRGRKAKLSSRQCWNVAARFAPKLSPIVVRRNCKLWYAITWNPDRTSTATP